MGCEEIVFHTNQLNIDSIQILRTLPFKKKTIIVTIPSSIDAGIIGVTEIIIKDTDKKIKKNEPL